MVAAGTLIQTIHQPQDSDVNHTKLQDGKAAAGLHYGMLDLMKFRFRGRVVFEGNKGE